MKSSFFPVFSQVIISVIASYILVLVFNFYNLNKISLIPKLLKTWLKILVLTLPIFFVINALYQSGKALILLGQINFGSEFQNLPNYLTFFATVLTAYLLYRTLTSQNKTNKQTAFESRLFKFIDYHRENVMDLKYRDPESSGERYWEGNQVFTVIFYEICNLLNELEKEKNFDFSNDKLESIDFVYHCVFFGAGHHGLKILEEKFSNKYNLTFNHFKNRVAKYSSKDSLEEPNDKVYYSGHVRRLGHYFRNIYQAVKYVESQTFLTANEKYDYVTLFRSQMSVHEQSVFFFNSLSSIGRVWEYEKYSKKLPSSKIVLEKEYRGLLITKYDLIRNAINNNGKLTEHISIKSFYPLINLEREEECVVFGVLPFTDNTHYICRFCFSEKYIGYQNEDLKEKMNNYFENQQNNDILNQFRCDELNCKSTAEIEKIRKVRIDRFTQ